jgi:gliding motility-associated-like protein
MKPLKRLMFCCFIFLASKSFSQSIALYNQHNGRYDYKAIGNTLNTSENGAYTNCNILTGSSADLNIDSNQTVIAAYLYWAGSGDGDFDINLNNTPITPDRTFYYELDENRKFFAAFTDISQLVQDHGSGTYTLSDLENINISQNYCSTGTNFAGWSIVVIYEDQNLPLHQINIYDGLEAVPDAITIQLDNLNVLDVEGAKIGFIAWEGDSSLEVNESLKMNGYILSNPPLNPETNAFNGTNSFTGQSNLYNMDIDFYNIQNTINVGDTSATIELTSGQDLVMVNNIITVLNSQLPDATIELNEDLESTCFSRIVTLNYSVSNFNSTAEIPEGTPIAFYIDNALVGQAETEEIIGIGETIEASINIEIDSNIPEEFEIIAVVDDDGTGNGNLDEINEENNSDVITLELSNEGCPIVIPQGFSPNGDGLNDWFNIQGVYDVFLNHNLMIYNRYGTLIFEGNNDLKWNGTSNRGPNPSSKKLPVGTYFYVLHLNEEGYETLTGWVYLNY